MKRGNRATSLTFLMLMLGLLMAGSSRAGQLPIVTNVMAQQRSGTILVDVSYDLADGDSDSLFVRLFFSRDGGGTWALACRSVSGHVGRNVLTGAARQIVWNAGADSPGLDVATCRLRVVADDEEPRPEIAALRLLSSAGNDTLTFAPLDTIPYGRSFGFVWSGYSPVVEIYPPQILAVMDSVPPLDGIIGYQFSTSLLGCLPTDPECWRPRQFVEATGDSVPYFGTMTSLWFANDGSRADYLHQRLPSGVHELFLNARDVDGMEIDESMRDFAFVVNYDPETLILNGEQDWAHPEDPEVYPYYIQLNDPAGVHHPFQSGDRIPDRTYVVVKALARDDARDAQLDANAKVGFTGYLLGVRQNFTGGLYPFASQASAMNTQPAWDADANGWYGDTLGFLTAPRTHFTINMQGVDEHGRRDGTPASLAFDVGFEPCLQCIELLPKPSSSLSGFDANVACVESANPEYLATHPCLNGVTNLRVSATGVPDPDPARDLEALVGPAYILVNRTSGYVTNLLTAPTEVDSVTNYVLGASRYRMGILLHGKDDPRESWAQAVRRLGGVQYQVSNACDPYNSIQDGGGNDYIGLPTWGQPITGTGLVVLTASGLWKLEVNVFVPSQLLQLGSTIFRSYLSFAVTGGNAEATEMIYQAVTRQYGDGWVDVVVLDQTACYSPPSRPATFNFFQNVRPDISLAAGQSWRDCNLSSGTIRSKLPLSQGAMSSLGGEPVRKYFRLTLNPLTGEDIVCSPN